ESCGMFEERCENQRSSWSGNARPQGFWAETMPSTHKKVIVRKMDRDSVNGFVAPANFVHEGKLELLNTSGNVVGIDLRDIKAVYFVREFADSETLIRKTFTARPRTEGLWVRLMFKDSEVIVGMFKNVLTKILTVGL